MSKTITITRTIDAPCERVFDAWVTPSDLLHWYNAGEDWSTPHAEVDAVPGGKFSIGFADPDGKHIFDFTGTFTEVTRPSKLAYTIDDGRKVAVDLDEADGKTALTWTFEMEDVNSEELQRKGWSNQVDNLEKYLAQK